MAQSTSRGRPTYLTVREAKARARSKNVLHFGAAPVKRWHLAAIIIIVLVIVTAVVSWIIGVRGGAQNLRTYTAYVDKLLDRSRAVEIQFDELRHNIKGLANNDIDIKLSHMESESETITQASSKAVVPSKATDLQPLLLLALDLRAQGISEFKNGIDAGTGINLAGATQSISKGLKDLVVSDQVFMRYSDSLQSKLKAADLAGVQVADAGQAVPTVDDASTASIDQYLSTSVNGDTNAMMDYLNNEGIDTSSVSVGVVSVSMSDPNWKLDHVSRPSGQTKYFLLHSVNGIWTVVDYRSSFTATQMKADGAPSDLTPP